MPHAVIYLISLRPSIPPLIGITGYMMTKSEAGFTSIRAWLRQYAKRDFAYLIISRLMSPY